MKNNFLLQSLLFILMSGWAVAQPYSNPNNQQRLDGIAAVVGDEIVLTSDIEREHFRALADGLKVESNCEFLENIMVEKLLLSKAKQDTLITITMDEVDRQVESRIQGFLQNYSEQEILDGFGMSTMAELKEDMRDMMRDYGYSGRKQEHIVSGVDAAPEQVREFYEQYKNELPDIPEEVSLSHIVIYPEITPEHEQEVIAELNKYKNEVEGGASFATKAILYSDDPGSASNGGLMKNVKRGMMVPEFDAVIFNLEEGEISEPFKTDFGYHIAMLEKRRGQELDVRHILIQLKPTPEEWTMTKQKLDSIVIQIDRGELTFREAAVHYSVDKYTKYNGGKLMTGDDDRMERSKLPSKMLSAISGLNDGEISESFEDEFDRLPVLRVVRLDDTIPAHKINLETDYARLKRITVNTLQQEEILKWVENQIDDTFIKVGEEYQSCEFRMNWLRTEVQ